MSDLTFLEKTSFEELFGMKSGYVLDFSDHTFQEFVCEATGLDILDKKYHYRSGSKANRLRGFWKEESNYSVGTLMSNLLEYWLAKVHLGQIDPYWDENAFKECSRIVDRLKKNIPVAQIDTLDQVSEYKDFNLLAKSIRESIEKNEPEAALDRLHTFVIKYCRQLCDRYSISYRREDPLHSIFGKYVKLLLSEDQLESVMSERILKTTISILDAFNDIRNNKSLAHDNPLLNYQESILILNSVSNAINFIESVEAKRQSSMEIEQEDDLPF